MENDPARLRNTLGSFEMNNKIHGVRVAECQPPRAHGALTAAPDVSGTVIPILEIRMVLQMRKPGCQPKISQRTDR